MIRRVYRKLPIEFRDQVRSLTPKELRRWAAHRRSEVYLISYPKCGRTWLRLMLGRAFANYYSLPAEEDILFLSWQTRPHPHLPLITVIHEDRPMLKAPDELHESKDKFRNKMVIFLARDPRDVIVSSYFEMKKRGQLFGDNPYENRSAEYQGSLEDFIYRKEGGFETVLRYYNIWAQNRQVPKGFLLVHYEDLKVSPQAELRRIVDFLGLQEIDDGALREAVEFASFENMRKMEEQRQFQGGMLNPANQKDQESYKTRRGKIGGYAEYFSPEQIEYLNRKMKTELSSFYGYTP